MKALLIASAFLLAGCEERKAMLLCSPQGEAYIAEGRDWSRLYRTAPADGSCERMKQRQQ